MAAERSARSIGNLRGSTQPCGAGSLPELLRALSPHPLARVALASTLGREREKWSKLVEHSRKVRDVRWRHSGAAGKVGAVGAVDAVGVGGAKST